MSLVEKAPAEQLSLEIPQDSAHIVTARSFAGGVARALGLDEEASDALKLILTEVCSEAIERRRGGRIVISVSAGTDPIRVTVVADGVLGDQVEPTYRRTLIEALAPDATFDEQEDRLSVAFTLPGNV